MGMMVYSGFMSSAVVIQAPIVDWPALISGGFGSPIFRSSTGVILKSEVVRA